MNNDQGYDAVLGTEMKKEKGTMKPKTKKISAFTVTKCPRFVTETR